MQPGNEYFGGTEAAGAKKTVLWRFFVLFCVFFSSQGRTMPKTLVDPKH